MSKYKIPRFMITATGSGMGKTLITCGILQILEKRGYDITSFKCGPDYIDPMFHAKVMGTKSRNLDAFFTQDDTLRQMLVRNAEGCDIAVLEGVMGYYDGLAGVSARASAYEIAKKTQTPTILIVNCKGMSVSILPTIKGFIEYKPNNYIYGVILNQISPMFYEQMKMMVECKLGIEVYGYVPKLEECLLDSRHLGLILPEEVEDLQDKLDHLAQTLENTLDIDKIMALAYGAREVDCPKVKITKISNYEEQKVRIAVAYDEAFCFIYEENLEYLCAAGAEIVEFSPLHDKELPPNIHGIMLNGGYPELHAKQLSENESMKRSILKAVQDGIPCIAECGGFMYLHEELKDVEENAFAMVGAIEGKAYNTGKLSRFGYITLRGGTVFGKEVGDIPAHEFHYFDSTHCGEAFVAKKPLSERNWNCIISTDTMLAGFPHFYFYANTKVAEAYLDKCREYKKSMCMSQDNENEEGK